MISSPRPLRRAQASVVLGAALCLGPALAASPSAESLLTTLRDATQGAVQLQQDASTHYQLLRATSPLPLLQDAVNADVESRALGFLAQFGSLIGVTDPVAQLVTQRVSQDRAGHSHVHMDQVHQGLPVFGARLVVHMNNLGIRGTSGVFLGNLGDFAPAALSAEALDQIALRAVSKTHGDAVLQVRSSREVIYNTGLLRGVEGSNHRSREVMVHSEAGDVRERLIIDTQSGQILNRIDEIHSLQNREIYTPNQDVPPVITEGSALAPADIPLTGDVNSDPVSRLPRAPQDNLYIFAGGTYELYRNLFGREGYDDGALPPEEQVQKSVYLINDACPNAYWNGDSTNYCPGFDADDIVSHEWSHAYTEYTHGLIYQYQSGALNEAYSDIFGEMYDLVNGIEGPLGVTLTEGEYFENGGSRWVLGEDLSEAAAGLLLRDMWDPDNFGANVPVLGIPVLSTPSPGSVITSPNYYCGSGDGGGVHTNSGVPNHAFAMLVDGKEFNGVTIPAIGMTRAAHIYFQAMTHYQIPSTNFAQHADALTQSCQDLLGAPLNDVLGNASPDVITSETCAAVEAAMVATEMRDSPAEKCGYRPLLQPEATVPAVCRAGGEEVVDFVEGFSADGLPEGWTSTDNITGDTQEEGVTWQVTTDLPAPHTGVAAFIPNTFGGTCAPGGDISASFQLDTPAIVLSSADSTLSLNHLMQSEFAYDGGNLKYSLNGGDFAVVPAEAFLFSPHNTTLETGAGDVPDPLGLVSGGNTSPIAGEEAWSGSDEGESSSSWGISRVSTAALGASAGDSLQFRFEFGQDGCNGNLGWYLDEVKLSHCSTDGRSEEPGTPSDSRGLGTRGGGLGGLILLPLVLLARRRRR